MQQYRCSVRLADKSDHVVTNKVLTVPEIAILQRVHGSASAVSDFAYVDTIERTDAEERERLSLLYDHAALGESEPVVNALFGAHGKLPHKLSDIGIDAKSRAASQRARAEQLLREADQLEEQADGAGDVATLFDEDDEAPAPASKRKAA